MLLNSTVWGSFVFSIKLKVRIYYTYLRSLSIKQFFSLLLLSWTSLLVHLKYSWCREERLILYMFLLNRLCHNVQSFTRFSKQVCLSYRKLNFKHFLLIPILYVSTLFLSYKRLKFGILSLRWSLYAEYTVFQNVKILQGE